MHLPSIAKPRGDSSGTELKAATLFAKSCWNTPACISHFGDRILTFQVSCLFQTETGIDPYIMGAVNRPKHGIAPLSGVIETDWSPIPSL